MKDYWPESSIAFFKFYFTFCRILEKTGRETKSKIGLLLTKSETDDQFIEALKEELSNVKVAKIYIFIISSRQNQRMSTMSRPEKQLTHSKSNQSSLRHKSPN
jgi:hypothetical protein